MTGVCELCGESFETTIPNRRFCCEQHRKTSELQRRQARGARRTQPAVCEWCGVHFMAEPGRGRFCGKSHAVSWSNAQRGAEPKSTAIVYASCEECGALYVMRHGRKTCGAACWRLRTNKYTRQFLQKSRGYGPARWQSAGLYECAHCGEWFVVPESRPHAKKYCGDACLNANGSHRRRIAERGAAGSHTGSEWLEKLNEYAGRCAYCGIVLETPSKTNPRSRTKDHVVPLVHGGTDYIDNIVPACLRCNGRKGASRDFGAQAHAARHKDVVAVAR